MSQLTNDKQQTTSTTSSSSSASASVVLNAPRAADTLTNSLIDDEKYIISQVNDPVQGSIIAPTAAAVATITDASIAAANYLTLSLPEQLEHAEQALILNPRFRCSDYYNSSGEVAAMDNRAVTYNMATEAIHNPLVTGRAELPFLSDLVSPGSFSVRGAVSTYMLETQRAAISAPTVLLHSVLPPRSNNNVSTLLLDTAANMSQANALNINNLGLLRYSRRETQVYGFARSLVKEARFNNVGRLIRAGVNIMACDNTGYLKASNSMSTPMWHAAFQNTPVLVTGGRNNGNVLYALVVPISTLEAFQSAYQPTQQTVYIPFLRSDTPDEIQARILSYIGDYAMPSYVINDITLYDDTTHAKVPMLSNSFLYTPYASSANFNDAIQKIVLVDMNDSFSNLVLNGAVNLNFYNPSAPIPAFVDLATAYIVANYPIINRGASCLKEFQRISLLMSPREVYESMLYLAEICCKMPDIGLNSLQSNAAMCSGTWFTLGLNTSIGLNTPIGFSAVDRPVYHPIMFFGNANQGSSPFGRINGLMTFANFVLAPGSAEFLAAVAQIRSENVLSELTIPTASYDAWFLFDLNLIAPANVDGASLVTPFVTSVNPFFAIIEAMAALMCTIGANTQARYGLSNVGRLEGGQDKNLTMLWDSMVPMPLGLTHKMRIGKLDKYAWKDLPYVAGADMIMYSHYHSAQRNAHTIMGTDLYVVPMRVPAHIFLYYGKEGVYDYTKKNLIKGKLWQGSLNSFTSIRDHWRLYTHRTNDKEFKFGPWFMNPPKNALNTYIQRGPVTNIGPYYVVQDTMVEHTGALTCAGFVENYAASTHQFGFETYTHMENVAEAMRAFTPYAYYVPINNYNSYFHTADDADLLLGVSIYQIVVHLGDYDIAADADGYGQRMMIKPPSFLESISDY